MTEQRPPLFAGAVIEVRAQETLGEPAATLTVAGVTVTLTHHEARALCRQLYEAFDMTPEARPR